MPTVTGSFITGSVGSAVRGVNQVMKFAPGYDNWSGEMNRNLELISQGLQFAGNVKNYQMSGVLDFGRQNIWSTHSVVVPLMGGTGSIHYQVVDPGTGGSGYVDIPLFGQLDFGRSDGHQAKTGTRHGYQAVTQISLYVSRKHVFDAASYWRFRIRHTGAAGDVIVKTNDQSSDIDAFIPYHMMAYGDRFLLDNSNPHIVRIQISKRGSTAEPPPLIQPTVQLTYVVANTSASLDTATVTDYT